MNLWQMWDFIKDKSKKSLASRFLISHPSQKIISNRFEFELDNADFIGSIIFLNVFN